jgi:hypothetical protein
MRAEDPLRLYNSRVCGDNGAMPEEIELPETPETPESRKDRTVGLIIAVIAVILAIVTHAGNEIHQDEILAHVDASDQYAFYQAKKDHRILLELRLDDLQLQSGALTANAQTLATKLSDTYNEEIKHLDADGVEIKAKADELMAESRQLARKASILDIGEIALQISVVLCSITILTEQRLFARLGLAVAVCGVLVSAWALLFTW